MTATTFPNSFGAWVRTRRRQLDLTQSELGKRAGCSEAAIRKIEADERKPSRQLAELLAKAIEIPPSEKETFLQFSRGVLIEEIRIGKKSSPNNLPVLLTSTVDRTRDLANVSALLKEKSIHLISLIGLPGIGKTRLSIHCGNEVLDDFPDGVWFVDLAEITNADFFIPSITRFMPTLSLPPSPVLSQLLGGLKDKTLLLVLDNFEQIVEDASLDVAQILKTCPNIKILVTSRVPLHIYGENEYPLPPLSIPPRDVEMTHDKLMQFESVQLFVARTRQHHPKFSITKENGDAVIEICTVLDGIPLALELAAATLRQMTLDEMVSLLRGKDWVKQIATPARDLPQRQRTLENVIDWSYTLLTDEQKDFFCELGVFYGWLDAEAAAAVSKRDDSATIKLLNSLTDHSLLVREIVHGKTYWHMLELIHEFAASKLTSERRSHLELLRAEYFLHKIQVLKQTVPRGVQDEYFLTNFSNFQNAVKWAAEEKQTELCFQLISVLIDYWEDLGYFKEGLDVVSRFLRSPADIDPRKRAYLLDSASTLAWQQHDFETALVYAKEALQQEHAHGREDKDRMYFNLLGRIYIEQGKFAEARAALEECLALLHESSAHFSPGPPLAQLGEIALFEGRLDEAKSLLQKALTVLDKEDAIFLAMANTDLVEVALAEGDLANAKAWLKDAYPQANQHMRRFIVFLCALAGYLVLAGKDKVDLRAAAQFYGAIEKLSTQSGVGFNTFYQNLNQERMQLAREKLSDEEWLDAFESGRGWERGEAIHQAKDLVTHNRR